MKSSVCRCLFGPADHDQRRGDLKLKLGEMSAENNERWNFNFVTDTPMPGRFEWESTHVTAEFYLEMEAASPGRDSSTLEGSNRGSSSKKHPDEVTPVRGRRTVLKARRNARITDFFVKRRRTCTESKLSNFVTSSSDTSLCKTLR
ncbi:cyclin-dependent kinase inhibitor 1-like [Entelurus aequoreus]|uniref:cyclin-dependent kinase inhibitor 1-like n=1 Tax=Entelurus aequoreus TaxID=161455 RepID=UPI002B1D14D3|nr:cyclin-dependent kinase inhibitor 1-like [Entelurus aequoreus]